MCMKEIAMQKIPFVTRAVMIEVDRLMIDVFNISLLQMMENAGRNLANLARFLLNTPLSDNTIIVLCGGGNNGGGGMAAARHLVNWGAEVCVALSAPTHRLGDAPLQQIRTLRKMGVNVIDELPTGEANLVIDALIGYGLKGKPRGRIREWIQWINHTQIQSLALDIPSGMDADTGAAAGVCVRASATMTLALPKAGFKHADSSMVAGDIYLADISVPNALYRKIGISPENLFEEEAIIRLI